MQDGGVLDGDAYNVGSEVSNTPLVVCVMRGRMHTTVVCRNSYVSGVGFAMFAELGGVGPNWTRLALCG